MKNETKIYIKKLHKKIRVMNKRTCTSVILTLENKKWDTR